MIRGLFLNLCLSLFVSIAFALGLEGLGRLYEWKYPPPDVAGYIWDWQVEWQGDFPIPTGARTPFPVDALNGDGFRDRWHSVEKPEFVHRIACLGDSVTFGAEISAEEAYPQVLERQLLAQARRVDVMNAAAPGWSTRQERIAYERIVRRYRPDQVLLGVCLNDIPELQNNLSRPPGWLGGLYRQSSFVRAVVGARDREIGRVEELFRPADAQKRRHALSLFFDEVRALRRDVEADGGRLAVAVFPFRFQVEASPPDPVVQREILDFCAREGLACLDLLPALAPLGEGAFVDYDHLSPRGSEAAVDALLRSGQLALAQSDDEVASQALGRPISKALSAESARVRAAIVGVLARRPDGAAYAKEVEGRLLADSSPGVRLAAVDALIALRASAAGPVLLSRLRDDDEAVRWRSSQLLAGWPLHGAAVPDLIAALGSSDPYVRRFAVWKLGEVGADARPAAEALLALLADKGSAEAWGASTTLGRIGAVHALPAVVDDLRSASIRRRVEAAKGLGLMGRLAVPAIPSLVGALDDADAEVRAVAVGAIAQIEVEQVALRPAIMRRARDDDSRVRAAVAAALGRPHLAGPEPTKVLARLVRDARQEVRASASSSLGVPGNASPAAVAALVEALADGSPVVRLKAATSLGALGTMARGPAAPALRQAVEADRAPRVRREAARALASIGEWEPGTNAGSEP